MALDEKVRAYLRELGAALNEAVFAAPGLDAARVADLVDVLHELRRDAGDF